MPKITVWRIIQCCTKSKIIGRPTDHPWWKSGWSVSFLNILLWYSRSVHPEKWHALYNVNACENYYPGKWQAMHDANACENYIAIILRWQAPCFQMYANTSVYCNTVALLLFICHKNAIEKPREICMETGSTSSATKVIAMYTRERGSPEANSGLSTSNLLLSYLILSFLGGPWLLLNLERQICHDSLA